jgi:hypothetical protein
METKNINEFKANVDGKEVAFLIRNPSVKDKQEAQKVYNKVFGDALLGKAIVRKKLDDILRSQNLWDDEKQIEFKTLTKSIADIEYKLNKGGIKKSEARSLCIELWSLRDKLRDLIAVRNQYDNITADAQADNAYDNYMVAVCTVYKDSGQPYFKSYDDYLNQAENEVSLKAANTYLYVKYGMSEDYEMQLPENKILKKLKFLDEKGRLVNEKGQLVDVSGNRIDEDGYRLDENGKRIDYSGRPVDKTGKWDIETLPFLDDDGNPIVDEEPAPETNTEPVSDVKTDG